MVLLSKSERLVWYAAALMKDTS